MAVGISKYVICTISYLLFLVTARAMATLFAGRSQERDALSYCTGMKSLRGFPGARMESTYLRNRCSEAEAWPNEFNYKTAYDMIKAHKEIYEYAEWLKDSPILTNAVDSKYLLRIDDPYERRLVQQVYGVLKAAKLEPYFQNLDFSTLKINGPRPLEENIKAKVFFAVSELFLREYPTISSLMLLHKCVNDMQYGEVETETGGDGNDATIREVQDRGVVLLGGLLYKYDCRNVVISLMNEADLGMDALNVSLTDLRTSASNGFISLNAWEQKILEHIVRLCFASKNDIKRHLPKYSKEEFDLLAPRLILAVASEFHNEQIKRGTLDASALDVIKMVIKTIGSMQYSPIQVLSALFRSFVSCFSPGIEIDAPFFDFLNADGCKETLCDFVLPVLSTSDGGGKSYSVQDDNAVPHQYTAQGSEE